MNDATIIIPCFNAEMNLDLLTNSLLAQKNHNWKCILVDDMSTDDTWKKIKTISDDAKDKFQAIRNTEKNS